MTAQAATAISSVFVPEFHGSVDVRKIHPALLDSMGRQTVSASRFDFRRLVALKLSYGIAVPTIRFDEAEQLLNQLSPGAIRPILDEIDRLSETDEHLPRADGLQVEIGALALAWINRPLHGGPLDLPTKPERECREIECSAELPPYKGRGRPPRYCKEHSTEAARQERSRREKPDLRPRLPLWDPVAERFIPRLGTGQLSVDVETTLGQQQRFSTAIAGERAGRKKALAVLAEKVGDKRIAEEFLSTGRVKGAQLS